MSVVYLDSLFLTELAADFMLLLATDRFCAAAVSWKRLLAAAIVGALYSVAYALAETVLGSPAIKIVFGVLMLLAAFGGRRDFMRCGAVFLLCAAAFAGIVLAVSIACGGFGVKQLIFSFAAAYALMGGILRFASQGKDCVKVIVRHSGHSLTLTALRDTGNSLRDPISGTEAIIAYEETLLPLLEDDVRAILRQSRGQPAETRLEQLWSAGVGRGFKVLPYSAIGVESGLLLAFRAESAQIDGREVKGVSAVLSPQDISAGGGYSAIVSARA